MKKLKILLPSLSVIAALAFSITFGIYAASQVKFTVGGYISFVSPDIGAEINCYVNAKDSSIEHTWNNVANGGTIVEDNTETTKAWDLNEETLIFNQNNTLTLNFEISNKTGLRIFAYIADSTGSLVGSTKNFNGTNGTQDLVTATAGAPIEISAGSTTTPTVSTTMLTITFTLNKTDNIKSDSVDISSLGWQVRLSKTAPTA